MALFEQTLTPVTHDLGQFQVRRVLPSKARSMVGPFIFVDQFGPAQLDLGSGMDVRPHPHINLATVTWLFEGAIDHRDSLGSFSTIRPGQVNLMTAGRGLVHSERSPAAERRRAGIEAFGSRSKARRAEVPGSGGCSWDGASWPSPPAPGASGSSPAVPTEIQISQTQPYIPSAPLGGGAEDSGENDF